MIIIESYSIDCSKFSIAPGRAYVRWQLITGKFPIISYKENGALQFVLLKLLCFRTNSISSVFATSEDSEEFQVYWNLQTRKKSIFWVEVDFFLL